MQVALAKHPAQERPEPEGMVRENDDWVFAEFAELPQFRGIDVAPEATEENPDGLSEGEEVLQPDPAAENAHPLADPAR